MQKFFTEIRFTEIKAALMDDPNISREIKHRIQVGLEVASQPGSGTASLIVPTEKCLDMDDNAAIQAAGLLQTWSPYPSFTFANQMPAELHSNGTACHTDR